MPYPIKPRFSALVCVAAAFMIAGPAWAHFVLMSPEPWLVQNAIGDPQKLAPCGGVTGDPGTPTGKITAMRGGDMLHIKVREAIYHPGHYRVALSVLNRSELPGDPVATTRASPNGPISVSAKIDPAPRPPVLADGLFVHETPPDAGSFWETDIRLPNINCEKCTVQIIQFMEQHGVNPDGEFSYHHCADLKITANPALPIDRNWPGQAAS